MSVSIDQAKRLFSAMCFATENHELFEKSLNTISENDWPIIFLASIIIENCGLKQIHNDLINVALQYKDTQMKNSTDNWVPVPNQYILRDRAWLYPVIRACDPSKIVFKEEDYGITLIENLCEKLSINLRKRELKNAGKPDSLNGAIEVNLTHAIRVIMLILSYPGSMGVSYADIESVLRSVLNDEGYETLARYCSIISPPPLLAPQKPLDAQAHSQNTLELLSNEKRSSQSDHKSEALALETAYNSTNEELSKGLILLAVLTLSFVATSLMSGYYYKPVAV